MEKRFCEHCDHELYEYDDYGNYGWHCPKDCDFIEGCKKHEEKYPFELEAADIVGYPNIATGGPPIMAHAVVKEPHCWSCGSLIIRLPQFQDYPYGHFCPVCPHSLRDHPVYGMGGPMDLASKKPKYKN